MPFHTRRVRPEDGPALLTVRAATLENPFSLAALTAAGITPGFLAAGLQSGNLAGWLTELTPGGQVVGFCLAKLPEAELWVLAILPSHERRGIGRDLLARTETLLWSAGHSSAWLWTSPDRTLRAYQFYLSAGWQEDAQGGARIYLRKRRPA